MFLRKFVLIVIVIIGVVSLCQLGCQSSCGKVRYLAIWNLAHEEKQYEKAISEFQDFINSYLKGKWTTYARLHIGDCFY